MNRGQSAYPGNMLLLKCEPIKHWKFHAKRRVSDQWRGWVIQSRRASRKRNHKLTRIEGSKEEDFMNLRLSFRHLRRHVTDDILVREGTL